MIYDACIARNQHAVCWFRATGMRFFPEDEKNQKREKIRGSEEVLPEAQFCREYDRS